MEKQLIIDTFNADRASNIEAIMKRHKESCKLTPKEFLCEVMKALISEEGINLIEKYTAQYNGFDGDIIYIVVDELGREINYRNGCDIWSQDMIEAAKQRQRNAYKGSWAKVNDPAPAWSK